MRLAGAPPGGLDAGGTHRSPAASPCCPSHFASWESRALPETDVIERCWLAPTQYGRIPLSLLPTHTRPHDISFIYSISKGAGSEAWELLLGREDAGELPAVLLP